ncbi:hypothetical protein GCM10011508_06050 [Flavobacterium lutivivi]|nr:hypothetical protein GCM10011508_06050 [Flavobacterium lutivivi]
MNNSPQNNDSQEIDLSQISRKIGGFFDGIIFNIFRIIFFLKRNIVLVGILLVLGAGLGYFLDKTNKNYENQIVVIPNFDSVDYLYSKIELINSKVKEGDTIFLKNVVGIKNPKKLGLIEIKPITDVYKFIKDKDNNFEMIKLMAEDGDIKKIIEENVTSKNYPYHLITFFTSEETSLDKTINPILNYLNQSDYYAKIQKEYVNNVKVKMIENDTIIKQIDGFLNSLSKSINSSQKSDKLVYYNENSQLNDVIKTKDQLVYEQGSHRLELVNLDKIIKDNSVTINSKNSTGVNGKMKFIIPLFFILILILLKVFRKVYQKQLSKVNS